MSKLKTSLGGNTGALLAGGAMIAALGLGAYLNFGGQEAVSAPESKLANAAVSETTTAQTAVGAAEAVKEPAAEAAKTSAPSFDEVRREPDGTTIIAGRAEPMSDVQILVDGEQVGTATADSNGGFAAIANLPATGAAQVVSLSAKLGEETMASVGEIILTPSTVTKQASDVVQQIAVQKTNDDTVEPEETATLQEEAEMAPAVLKSDAQGVSLLSPRVTNEVALDTIGYSELGEVQLTGRAQPDTAKLRVYLNNRSVISLPVGSDGRWSGDLPDVDEGIYTLRVDEVSTAGTVSSRVETPFKRESAQVLAEASANAEGPINSITVQTGATLWAIARERYGDGTLYLRVVAANGESIRNPDLIYPGQVFDLPN